MLHFLSHFQKRFEISDFVKIESVNNLHALPMSVQHNFQDTQESVNKIV